MTLNEVRAACNVCTQCPLSVTRNSVVFGVGPEKTPVMFVGEGRCGGIVVAPAQHGLELGRQDALVEGLGQEIVGSQIHCHDHVHPIGSRRQEQDGHLGNLANFPAPVVAVEEGQPDVQQDDVGLEGQKVIQHPPEVLRAARLQLPQLRLRPHRLRDAGVVLHNQEPVRHDAA